MADEPALELWLWTITDAVTKRRRQTRYRMDERTAREQFGDDAMKVDGSLEVYRPLGSTSDFQRKSP